MWPPLSLHAQRHHQRAFFDDNLRVPICQQQQQIGPSIASGIPYQHLIDPRNQGCANPDSQRASVPKLFPKDGATKKEPVFS